MSLFDKLTKKEEALESQIAEVLPKTKENKPKRSVKSGASHKKTQALKAKESVLANKVLLRPRITEKSYTLNSSNQYVFEVTRSATKKNIAQAIQEAYGVRVRGVRIVNLPSKAKTFGRRQEAGSRSAVKKAIVQLASGENLEIFKAEV